MTENHSDQVTFWLCSSSSCENYFVVGGDEVNGDHCKLCSSPWIKECSQCSKLITDENAEFCSGCGTRYRSAGLI